MPTLIEHDFPADTPVAVVVNCSQTEQLPPEGHSDALRVEALELLKKGFGDQAVKVMDEARRIDELAAAGPAVQVRPFTDEELAQRAIDDETHKASEIERLKQECAAVLRLTDWTQVPDVGPRLPKGTTVKKWADYRQLVAERRAAIADLENVPGWPKPPAQLDGLPSNS